MHRKYESMELKSSSRDGRSGGAIHGVERKQEQLHSLPR